jgi:hypothetical protein
MPWSVDWDGAFVVGGAGTTTLTPNFKLKEFQTPDGKCRVHRELVTAIQVVRDRFAKPLRIVSVDPDGLGAALSGDPVPDLANAAAEAQSHGLLEQATPDGKEVRVRIPDPSALPDITVEDALKTAFLVTSGFETSGDKFQQITGNFDKAGFSFGPAQVNFKSGTLQDLLKRLLEADEPALRKCFNDPDDYQELMDILPGTSDALIAWANSKSTGRNNSEVVEPWRTYFHNIGQVERFREIMVAQIYERYGVALKNAIAYLNKVRPDIRIDHLRCICSLWDLCIQQGRVDYVNRDNGIDVPKAIAARVSLENPQDQFELVRIAVEERAAVSASYADDCKSRRLGLLNGVPTNVGEKQRANVYFYLLRDVRLQQAVDLTNIDVPNVIARASTAIASGAGVFSA